MTKIPGHRLRYGQTPPLGLTEETHLLLADQSSCFPYRKIQLF